MYKGVFLLSITILGSFLILLSNQASAQFGIGPFQAIDTVEATHIVDIVAGSAQKDSNLG